MSTDSTHDVTRLLLAWNEGDPAATERLMPLVYEHLRRLAREYMRRERGGHTLQATALVHEAYLALVDGTSVSWQGRHHFYNLAARAMRRILVDHARACQAERRGGRQPHLPLDEAEVAAAPATLEDPEEEMVALDAALDRLAVAHARPAQVVELRFFGGLELRDIAELLQVNTRTVDRDWKFAKLWLHRELRDQPGALTSWADPQKS